MKGWCLSPLPRASTTAASVIIADMPKSGVVWYFDQTDMKEAKKILGNTFLHRRKCGLPR